jgi:hypothetical protein
MTVLKYDTSWDISGKSRNIHANIPTGDTSVRYGIFSHFAKQLLPFFFLNFFFKTSKKRDIFSRFSNNSTSSASKVFHWRKIKITNHF